MAALSRTSWAVPDREELASLRAAMQSAAHSLSDQGPLENFIHHNTLHAFTDREFHSGLDDARELLGCSTYLTENEYRAAFEVARVAPQDLEEAVAYRERFHPHHGRESSVATSSQLPIDIRNLAGLGFDADTTATSPLRSVLLHKYEPAQSGADARWRASHQLVALVAAWPQERLEQARAWLGACASECAQGTAHRAERKTTGSTAKAAPSHDDGPLLSCELIRRWCGRELMSDHETSWCSALAQCAASTITSASTLHAAPTEIRGHNHRSEPRVPESLESEGNLPANQANEVWSCLAPLGVRGRVALRRWLRGQTDPTRYRAAVARRLKRAAETALVGLSHATIEELLNRHLSAGIDHWLALEARVVGDYAERVLELPRWPSTWQRHVAIATPRIVANVIWSAAQHATAQAARREPQGPDHTDPVASALEQAQHYVEDINRLRSPIDLLRDLAGEDLTAPLTEGVVRLISSYLDEGLARWGMPGRELGLFACLVKEADTDPALASVKTRLAAALEDGSQHSLGMDELGVSAPALVFCYRVLAEVGVPLTDVGSFVGLMMRRLWGWSAMIKWRSHHSARHHAVGPTPHLEEWVAVLLAFEVGLCTWPLKSQLRTTVETSRGDLEQRLSEVAIRYALWSGRLPGVLAQQARACLADRDVNSANRGRTKSLRDIASFEQHEEELLRAWLVASCLVSLPIQLGTIADQGKNLASMICEQEQRFDDRARLEVWQIAYEVHYRRALLEALGANMSRHRTPTREARRPVPSFQAAFCIDDREESLRRHLEEVDPGCETLGVAGFFGIAVRFRASDREDSDDLCPPGVSTVVEVHACSLAALEVAPGSAQTGSALARYSTWTRQLKSAARELHRATDHGPSSLLALPADGVRAWSELLVSTLQVFSELPANRHRCTPLSFIKQDELIAGRPEGGTLSGPQTDGLLDRHETIARSLGLALSERARLVEATLRNMGLCAGFSRVVVLVAHASTSSNNPHLSAYACGACGGQSGGPTARVFAHFVNDPAVREVLRAQGIDIPTETLFVAAEHDTCADVVSFFDLDQVDVGRRSELESVHQTLASACRRVAHERARRLSGGATLPNSDVAFRWISRRSTDLSQARPELGHANNAAAIVAPRSLSRGLFLDRRSFLISYDPDDDEDGSILERILGAVVPVCSGISLEYYFSRVDQALLGAGTKLPHNVVALVGVMNGACSDLRTGLPKQMIEIHEPMRLSFVVQAPLERVQAVMGRNAAVRQTFELEWAKISVIDAEGVSWTLEGRDGFRRFQASSCALSVTTRASSSLECYRGRADPVPPTLIVMPPTETRSI